MQKETDGVLTHTEMNSSWVTRFKWMPKRNPTIYQAQNQSRLYVGSDLLEKVSQN